MVHFTTTKISAYNFIENNKNKVISFLKRWKKNYKTIVMERVKFVNHDDETHYFSYFYPNQTSVIENIDIFSANKILHFERKAISIDKFEKFLEINYKNWLNKTEDFIIKYPDGTEYIIPCPEGFENSSPCNTFYLKENLILTQNKKESGKIYPCYRIYLEPQNFNYKEYPFTIVSEIGYPNLSLAIKEIFQHNNMIFPKQGYTDISFPLIIDLSHFQYKIKQFFIHHRQVEISLEQFNYSKQEKPKGILSIRYLGGRYQKLDISFDDKLNFSKKLDRVIVKGDFYLLSDKDIGFGGELYNKVEHGKLLDFKSHNYLSKGYYDVDYINLEELSEKDIINIIQSGESVTVELKSVIQEDEIPYPKIAKQMVGMANAESKGLVILGVNKKRVIEGVGNLDKDDFQDTLLSKLDSRCDPWIDFEIKEFYIEENGETKKLIVVSIIADKNKRPYLYRQDNKNYKLPLRRGSYTNWLIERDIREYYNELKEERI